MYFLALAALIGCSSFEGAATAFARTSSFRQAPFSMAEATLAGEILVDAVRLRFGAKEVTSVARGRDLSECAPNSLVALTMRSLAVEADLRQALRQFVNPGDKEETAYVREWGEAVQAFDPTDIPPESCAHLPTFQQQALVKVPFAFPTPIVATQWVERKPQQVCRSCVGVTHCSQLILSSKKCSGALDRWWVNATRDFRTLSKGKKLFPRWTRTLALGQDCLKPCARGCIWDCRVPGSVSPLDFHSDVDHGVDMSLDREALVADMQHWPDQELRSHMKYGVRFGADIPLQIVLTPQLMSLADAFDRTQSELKELVDRGWYALFDYLPFVPVRMHPKGATERKLENRPRPTTDGSHPHEASNIRDTLGEAVVSLNRAIRSACSDQAGPELRRRQVHPRASRRACRPGGKDTLHGGISPTRYPRSISPP